MSKKSVGPVCPRPHPGAPAAPAPSAMFEGGRMRRTEEERHHMHRLYIQGEAEETGGFDRMQCSLRWR